MVINPFVTHRSDNPTPQIACAELGMRIPMSRLVLGTMSFGDTADEAAFTAMFETALAAGVNSIDTANGYARGATEGLIAPLVKRYRDQIVLATKAGMPHPDAGDHSPLSARGLRASVEGSLGRLSVETIDLFYLHQPDRSVTLDETLTTVAELQAERKIGALGVSNYAAWQVADLEAAAARTGATRPVVGQNVYNLLARRIEDEWVEFAAAHHVLTMCYNPLAGGLLVGVPDAAAQAPSRFSTSSLADMYKKSRAEGFGREVQRRIMVGTYVLCHGYYDAYYVQAQKIRRLIADDFQAAFADKCDVIMGPVAPTVAWDAGSKTNDPVANYLADIFTLSTSLAGLPGMSIPCGFGQGEKNGKRPVGLQIIGNYFAEAKLLNIAHQYQQVTDWHTRAPEGV